MTHDAHGVTAAYDNSEKSRLQSAGWKFLNSGESPNLPPKVKPAPAEVLAEVQTEPAEPETDMLDDVVVNILPQLSGMSKAQLEAVRAREADGKARKGLLNTLADLIEAKG